MNTVVMNRQSFLEFFGSVLLMAGDRGSFVAGGTHGGHLQASGFRHGCKEYRRIYPGADDGWGAAYVFTFEIARVRKAIDQFLSSSAAECHVEVTGIGYMRFSFRGSCIDVPAVGVCADDTVEQQYQDAIARIPYM